MTASCRGLKQGKNTLNIQFETYRTLVNDKIKRAKADVKSVEQEVLKQLRCKEKPLTGQENYEKLKTLWCEQGWSSVADYLRFYNAMDVQPYVEAMKKYIKEFYRYSIDLTTDGISLPSLAVKIMYATNKKERLLHIDNKEVNAFYNKHIVGGPSIIFCREAEGRVLGFDARALYLYCLGQEMPVGDVRIWTADPAQTKYSAPKLILQDQKHKTRKSVISQGYFDWIDHVNNREKASNVRNMFLHREKMIKISASENKPFFTSNGFKMEKLYCDAVDVVNRIVYEFDGCYWHACEDCLRRKNLKTHVQRSDLSEVVKYLQQKRFVYSMNVKQRFYSTEVMRLLDRKNVNGVKLAD